MKRIQTLQYLNPYKITIVTYHLVETFLFLDWTIFCIDQNLIKMLNEIIQECAGDDDDESVNKKYLFAIRYILFDLIERVFPLM